MTLATQSSSSLLKEWTVPPVHSLTVHNATANTVCVVYANTMSSEQGVPCYELWINNTPLTSAAFAMEGQRVVETSASTKKRGADAIPLHVLTTGFIDVIFVSSVKMTFSQQSDAIIKMEDTNSDGETSTCYIDLRKENRLSHCLMYSYLPTPITESDARLKLADLGATTVFHPSHDILAYNQHGVIALFKHRGAWLFHWAAPHEPHTTQRFYSKPNSYRDELSAAIHSLEADVGFVLSIDGLCYLNGEVATCFSYN